MRSPAMMVRRAVVCGGVILMMPGCPRSGRPACDAVWPDQRADPAPRPPRGDPDDQLTSVKVRSNPSGAEIYLGEDGGIRGVTPMRVEVPTDLGEVKLRLTLAGYEEEVVQVPLDQDQDVRVGMTRAMPDRCVARR
jgi:hypothetical protein